MDNVKTFIKDNKGLVIIFVITVLVAIGMFIYNKTTNKEFVDKNLTEEEAIDVEYVKRNYQVNEYQNVTIELIDLLNDYYRSYINKLISSPEEAYEMLSEAGKEDFNNDYKTFAEYVEKINTSGLLTSKVSEYRTTKGLRNYYDIIDTEGNRFTIYENSVWDYEISFNGRN